MKSLVQLDLISRILCLHDCATNTSNCGQVDGKPMIVDFCIETRSKGYVKSDIVEKFYEGTGGFKYTGLMTLAVKIPQQEKVCILRESLQAWNLLGNIDKTVLEIQQWIRKIAFKVEVYDDLQRYVHDVKATIGILAQV